MFDQGQKKTTPSPPLVMLSSRVCETVVSSRKKKVALAVVRNHLKKRVPNSASTTAKTRECVSPRWPIVEPYEIPVQKPIPSKSGMTEKRMPATSRRVGMVFFPQSYTQSHRNCGMCE